MRLVSWTRALVYLTIAILLLVACHKFFRFIDAAPYVAFDDSFANISVFLATEGKYGIPVAPFAGVGRAIRPDSTMNYVMNYGPPTFILGAALDWLFGTSYAVLRSTYFFSLVMIVVLAAITFRAQMSVAALAFSSLLLTMFWTAQWPMFRPDSVTALLIAGTMAAGTSALAFGRHSAWLLTGLMASLAAGNHQIAWAVVPASIGIWLLSLATEERSTRAERIRHHIVAFVLFASGGLAGALLYLTGIGFRVSAVIDKWKGYESATRGLLDPGDQSFLRVLLRHFEAAWGQSEIFMVAALYALCVIGFIMLLLALWSRNRLVAALLAPPILIGTAYQLSLGLYTNFHWGYVIPIQLTVIWTACATIAAVLLVLSYALRRWADGFEVAINLAGVALALTFTGYSLQARTLWERVADTQVPFSEYLFNVLAEVPRNAKVFGDIFFGLEAGTRYNFVNVFEGLDLLEQVGRSERERFAPTFLVLNRYLDFLLYVSLGGVHPRANAFWSLNGGVTLPIAVRGWNSHYNLDTLVDAPPYGTTRIYRRAPSVGSGVPLVSAYVPEEKRWLKQLGAPIKSDVHEVSPLQLSMQLGSNQLTVRAEHSQAISLGAGIYLVGVQVAGTAEEESGKSACFIAATSTPIIRASGGDLGFGFPLAPCFFPGESEVHLLARHQGGALIISLLGSKSKGSFKVVTVRPLLQEEDGNSGSPLPSWDQWKVAAAEGTREVDGDATRIVGDRSRFGYQFISPPIEVPTNIPAQVSIDLTPEYGELVVGVLGYNGDRWLSGAKRGRRFQFNTEDSREIRVVISNANAVELDRPAQFRVAGEARMTFEFGGQGQYVDALAACIRNPSGLRPGYCLEETTPQLGQPLSANASGQGPRFHIDPLEDTAWEELIPPTRREGTELRIEGEPAFAAAYAAKSTRYRLAKGTFVAAAGTVRKGGIVLGLLDERDQWAATIAVQPGPFRKALEVPADGEYRIVIANNLPVGQRSNDVEVTEIGLVRPDPAEPHVPPGGRQ
jgi:hypothetical protein